MGVVEFEDCDNVLLPVNIKAERKNQEDIVGEKNEIKKAFGTLKNAKKIDKKSIIQNMKKKNTLQKESKQLPLISKREPRITMGKVFAGHISI